MYTGYFGKLKIYKKKDGIEFVSIARYNRFWEGKEYKKLAPPKEIINIEDKILYEKLYYEKVLNKLNPKVVYDELGENAVLLCYEKWDDIRAGKTFCHRRIVAEWLERELGINVQELESDNKEDFKQIQF